LSRQERIAQKHLGGALSAPWSVAFLVVATAYFFFAAFFAAFFAGAFLAAFFVAICLFSLFRWVASILQYKLQLSECIDSCNLSVKRKTTCRWKKWQQFFFSRFDGTSHEVEGPRRTSKNVDEELRTHSL
jgi:hypothetical protein